MAGAVAVARRMTDKHMESIDAILKNKPEAYTGYGYDAPWRSIEQL